MYRSQRIPRAKTGPANGAEKWPARKRHLDNRLAICRERIHPQLYTKKIVEKIIGQLQDQIERVAHVVRVRQAPTPQTANDKNRERNEKTRRYKNFFLPAKPICGEHEKPEKNRGFPSEKKKEKNRKSRPFLLIKEREEKKRGEKEIEKV